MARARSELNSKPLKDDNSACAGRWDSGCSSMATRSRSSRVTVNIVVSSEIKCATQSEVHKKSLPLLFTTTSPCLKRTISSLAFKSAGLRKKFLKNSYRTSEIESFSYRHIAKRQRERCLFKIATTVYNRCCRDAKLEYWCFEEVPERIHNNCTSH